MNPVVYKIRLDALKAGCQTSIIVKHNDTKSRKLRVMLYVGSEPYELTDGLTAVFRAIKPDGNEIYNYCTIEGSEISVMLTTQTINVTGVVKAEIELYGANGERLMSPGFDIYVEATRTDDEGVESSNEYTALTELMSSASTAIENMEDVTGKWSNPAISLKLAKESSASVTLSETGVDFGFVLPKYFQLLGTFENEEALRANVTNPLPGDMYNVGAGPPYDLYVFNEGLGDWENQGGIDGPQGEQGPKGDQGPQGIQGPIGATGPTGAQGPVGEQGPRGIQGPTGSTGPAGPQGPKGEQGVKGEQGPIGQTGPRGPAGPQGLQGNTGPKGDKGDPGESGVTTPVNTFFTLSVDSNGDLYAYCADGDIGVGVDLEDNGDLYIIIPED